MTRLRRPAAVPTQVVLDHVKHLRRQGMRDRTIADRRVILGRLAFDLGTPLLEVTAEQLDEWQGELDLSPSSVETYSAHVKAFYRWAEEMGRVPVSPAHRLIIPKRQKRLPRPIPERDLRAALALAPEPMRTWLVLSAYAGLRAGEIAKLRRDDVVNEDGHVLLYVDGKGGRPRAVPLAGPVALALAPYLVGGAGPLFPREDGSAWLPARLSRAVSVFFASVGMPYTLHQGRHRFGTISYRQSQDILEVGRMMGHASPATTALYVALSDGKARETVEAMAADLVPALRALAAVS